MRLVLSIKFFFVLTSNFSHILAICEVLGKDEDIENCVGFKSEEVLADCKTLELMNELFPGVESVLSKIELNEGEFACELNAVRAAFDFS